MTLLALRPPSPPTTFQIPPPFSSSPLLSNPNTTSLSLLSTPLRWHPLTSRKHSPPMIPFAASGPLVFLEELGLDDREAGALLEKHPELESATPESLRRRVLTLQSVGIAGFAIRRTVVRRPEILTSPEIEQFVEFVGEELRGLQPTKLERLLKATHPQFLPSFVTRVKLLKDYGIPGEKLAHVLNNVAVGKVFFQRSVDELEATIRFLGGYGWPELVIRRPLLLNLDLDTQLIPRANFLTELAGGDEAAASHVIRKLPAILSYTVAHFRSHLEFWRAVGLSREEVFKIVLVYPNIFSVSRERRLRPRVEFLEQCQMDAEDIFKFLTKAPLFVSLSFEENLSKKLCFLVKLGYRHRTKELALALGAATRTSSENMQRVVGLFFSHGFSCEDVLAMSKKHPQVLQYTCESLEKKMEFLIDDMEREVGELLVFPAFLGYKLQDRIKRRYEMKKDVRGKGMSLNKLLSVSSDRFYLSKG